ncbi:MAG: beta-propeller domain-containing protein [Sulfolobales archaeon]
MVSERFRRYIALATLIAVVITMVSMIYVGIRAPGTPGSPVGSGATPRKPGYGGAPMPNLSATGVFKSFSSYDEIKSFLLSISETMGSQNLGVLPAGIATVLPLASPTPAMVSPASLRASDSIFSTTNVQVSGVDELDIVKTDGRLIVITSYSRVYIVDAIGRRLLSSIDVNGSSRGAFLWGNTLAVIADDQLPVYRATILPMVYGSNTSIYIYDISNPSKPVLREKLVYSGSLAGARMINGTVYMVLSSPIYREILPLVNGAPLRPSQIFLVDQMPSRFATIASVDLSSGARSEISLLISPTTWIYMSPSRLYIASYIPPYAMATGKAIEVLSSLLPQDIGSKMLEEMRRGNISGALRIASDYLSTLGEDKAISIISNASARLSTYVFQEVTRIHILDVRGINITYRGSIDVPGHILDQFSIEEHRGYLIVATTASNLSARLAYPIPIIPKPKPIEAGTESNITIRIIECVDARCSERYISIPQPIQIGPQPPRIQIYVSLVASSETYNNVYIISPIDMSIAGSLENLARGERIYAARLVGDIFYLVTYRQVDPLYAIDVRDPRKPEILGYIKIPGFSEYLHPLQGNMLLGVGLEDRDLKISLFNTSDPRNIVEIASLKIEGATSPVLWDHHAFTIQPGRGLIMIPIAIAKISGNTAGIAVISYGANGIKLEKILEHDQAIRSLYIDKTIYTISQNMIKLFNIETLQEIASIPLKQ